MSFTLQNTYNLSLLQLIQIKKSKKFIPFPTNTIHDDLTRSTEPRFQIVVIKVYDNVNEGKQARSIKLYYI